MNGLREILGFFGFGLGTRVTRLEDGVRYAVTCDKVHEGLNTRLDDFKKGQETIQEDIKELLKR